VSERYGPCTVSATARPLRADAARNLDRILVAAREVFGERGLDAGVDEIARRAGVGKGTVYRRFPSKDDLMWAVVQATFAEMLADALAAGAEPDGERGLRRFLERTLSLQIEHRAFLESASEWFAGTDRSRRLHDELLAALTPLVRRAQAEGAVREDLEPADLPIVIHMLASVTQPLPKGDLTPQARERYFALVFDALRPAGARSPLPGSPYDPFC
jgi:AcrR family transcriptional regulator